MVLFCGAKQFKPELHLTFTHLCKDPHFLVRKTISSGFHEVSYQCKNLLSIHKKLSFLFYCKTENLISMIEKSIYFWSFNTTFQAQYYSLNVQTSPNDIKQFFCTCYWYNDIKQFFCTCFWCTFLRLDVAFWQVCKLLGNNANLIQSDLVALLKDESIEVRFPFYPSSAQLVTRCRQLFKQKMAPPNL